MPYSGPHRLDEVGDRHRLVRSGMAAVFAANAVFAPARFLITRQTGKLTPWWMNVAAALLVALLYLWYRRRPDERSSVAAHGAALLATVALLVPLAYGMSSTIWWLSLVGLGTVLLGRGYEAWRWGIGLVALAIAATLLEPHVQIAGAAGEPPLESALSRIVFMVLLLGMAAAFRTIANDRASALARARDARDRFLAHISHEIRTPLHGTMSMTELALRSPLPVEVRAQVETAHQSAGVLLELLNNVLDVARAESDALILEDRPFELHTVLGEVLRPLAAQARQKGLSFAAVAEEGVPLLRRGDRVRVSQIALNLVANALKFTDQGSIEVRLLSDPAGPHLVRLQVEDTGVGIETAQREAIFEAFTQADRGRGGAGLGLAIVRELARRMDGEVMVESEPWKGSRFTVRLRLPALEPASGPTSLIGSGELRGSAQQAPSERRLRILVCEDDPINQKVVRAMLGALGHDSAVVDSAEQAWERLVAAEFDVLLTDVELVGMDGIELARRVRARERDLRGARLPIVAGTAHVGDEERHRLLGAGIDVHLPKPFGLPALDKALKSALGD